MCYVITGTSVAAGVVDTFNDIREDGPYITVMSWPTHAMISANMAAGMPLTASSDRSSSGMRSNNSSMWFCASCSQRCLSLPRCTAASCVSWVNAHQWCVIFASARWV